MDSTTLTAMIAAGATVGGAIGVEVIRKVLSRSSEKEDYATTIRNELREEIKGLKTEIDDLQSELDKSREKALGLMEQAVKYNAEIERLKLAIERAALSQEKKNDTSPGNTDANTSHG